MIKRLGNCRIEEEIGIGGMALVYRAIQEPLERPVAIKMLKPSIAVDSQFAERFEREARFMANLQHENILNVHDFVSDSGRMYMVMEYVRGIDLYDLLEKQPVLPPDIAAIIALKVGRALDYAHFRGIIHRDIKPANIMISEKGEVKLMDFGIARDDTLRDLTETGTGLGTPSYMSPEQILGDRLDFRSDLFSAGIVLYQMLTGRKPFLEDDAKTVMQKIRLDRYTSPRKIITDTPRALERVLGRCMEKLPANRYPTTQAFIDDLSEYLHTRVPNNHSAHLVGFLNQVGEVSDSRAKEILAAGGPKTIRRDMGDRSLVRQTILTQGFLLALAVAGGVMIQTTTGKYSAQASDFASGAEGFSYEKSGTLSVVAEPWADVFLDGEKIGTTPMGHPIHVSAGTHFLRFSNPFFQAADREVSIEPGENTLVQVTLEPGK